MRHLWLKVGVLTSIFFTFTACSESNSTTKKEVSIEKKDSYGIPWEKDLKTAFLRAKSENKNVMIMAVSENCRWCEKMKKQTLSNEKVAKVLENYVLVEADRETPSERDQLPPFRHVPIIFFMTPHKEVIDNLRGYFEPEDFLEYITEMEED
jgi:thioredoxin-related protein